MVINFDTIDESRNGDSSHINSPANYTDHYRQDHHHFCSHHFGCAYFKDHVNQPGIYHDTPSSVC